MSTSLIIPLYNQSKHWSKILSGIKKQTVLPDKIYLMIDRPEDDLGPNNSKDWDVIKEIEKLNSQSKLNIKIIPVIETPPYIGNPESDKSPFLTPYIRNLGVVNALQDGMTEFIFIDGDCVPQNGLIEAHLKKGRNLNLPVLSVGRRRESIYRWQDRREHVSQISHLELFRDKGLLIHNPELFRECLIVWSCNIGLNLPAIKLLRKFNKKYYNRKEVFCSEFVGKWGGEDGFLGLQSWYCRILVTTIGEKTSGVEHIEHSRPKDKYTIKHMDFFNKQIETLRLKTKVNPLTVDFFDVY